MARTMVTGKTDANVAEGHTAAGLGPVRNEGGRIDLRQGAQEEASRRDLVLGLAGAAGLATFLAPSVARATRVTTSTAPDALQVLGLFDVTDYASVQAAVDAARGAGGGIVYFPPGLYELAQPLSIQNADSESVRKSVFLDRFV